MGEVDTPLVPTVVVPKNTAVTDDAAAAQAEQEGRVGMSQFQAQYEKTMAQAEQQWTTGTLPIPLPVGYVTASYKPPK